MTARMFFLVALLLTSGKGLAEVTFFPRECLQLVSVVTAAWDSPSGRMWRLERKGDAWRAVGGPVAVTVGQRGLGIGLGLHPDGLVGPLKVEGDKRAPAGVFAIESAFGTKARSGPRFPYRETTAADRWVDDPGSSHYNQWVREDDPGIRKDWESAEILRRPDGIYDLALVIGHNRGPAVRGRGSAIFMHRWSAVGRSTIGCTAMAQRHLEALFGWIEAEKRPLLVQVPRELLPGIALPEDLCDLLESLDAS